MKSKEANRLYQKEYYKRNKALFNARSAAWRTANPEKQKALWEAWHRKNPKTREQIKAANAAYYKRNLEKMRARTTAWRRVNAEKIKAAKADLKRSAINMYSKGNACCAWCGQADIDVLCLDHTDNGGATHRKELRSTGVIGWGVYRWVREQDYPPIFQVLCCNCNKKKEVLRQRGLPTTKEEALK